MSSFSIYPRRITGAPVYIPVQFSITGGYNEMYKILVRTPNGTLNYDPPSGGWASDYRLGSDNGEEPRGALGFIYQGDLSLLGTYTVTVDFMDSFPNSITKTFDVVSYEDYNKPFITYPASVQQAQRFNWTIEQAVPGETCTAHVVGPITFDVTIPIEAESIGDDNPPLGVARINDSYYDYDGTYTVTFNFSRSQSVTKTIVVTNKLGIVYPTSVVANQLFNYNISGGNAGESWTAHISGPSSSDIGPYYMDGAGNANYTNASFSTAGEYDIVWTFPQSGKIKRHITVIDGGGPSIVIYK